MADDNGIIEFFKWLLQAEIRWKNGLSALVALVSIVAVYFVSRHSAWFRELADGGNVAMSVALLVTLSISFLSTWLALSAAAGLWTWCRSGSRERVRQFAELTQINNTLGSLTDWQRSFLIRLITQDTMQIKRWEIGGYEAVWVPEVQVLRAKGILTEYVSGVLEIAPQYWQFLKEFWDPATERLNFPV